MLYRKTKIKHIIGWHTTRKYGIKHGMYMYAVVVKRHQLINET